MNKFVSAAVLTFALGFSTAAWAGFQGPGIEPTTAAEALKMKDDTPVVLIGQIEKSLGNEKYLFKDASGTITVEIDDDDWRGVDVKPQDVVIIKGEVDKDMFATEIDVDTVELKK